MKLCLLAPEFLPNQGGVGAYSFELSRELSRTTELTILTVHRASATET
jgi:hypothetical protein